MNISIYYFIKTEMDKLNSKKINIGNGAGSLITNYAMKTHIIRYLYDYYNYSTCSYKYIQATDDLNYIKNNKHYVSFYFKGFDYFLMFLKYKELYLCVLINKNNLKRDHIKVNYNDLKIISIPVRIKQEAYKGSIFSGKVIRHLNQSVFLIDNCLCLDGNNTIELDLVDKLHMVDNYIEKHHIDDEHMNIFSLRILHLYNYDDLPDMVYIKMKKSDMEILGIMFHPMRTNYVYVFDGDKIYSDKEIDCVFLIRKTDIPDVYELHVSSDNVIKKYDIALVPTMLSSFICKTMLGDKEECNVNCKYNNSFSKWEPISISNENINTEEEVNNKIKSVHV